MNGYWPATWSGEDGGPRRLQLVEGAALESSGRALTSRSRHVFGGTMVVQREIGELYFQGATPGADSTAWVERIDPHTLEPVARAAELPAGPWWPGGILAHSNGDLYVTQGRWCHRLAPDLSRRTSRELPHDRAYNSLVAMPDGTLVMKDMSADDTSPSQLIVLDPDDLSTIATHDLPEGSIARISADDHTVAVVGMQHLFALACSSNGIEEMGRARYRTLAGQTFGWDPVLDHTGSAWFLDNGEGTESFTGSFVGHTSSTAPLHLVRGPWPPNSGTDCALYEVCGEPGGLIANPPILVEAAHIAIGYDSSHGVMTAWRWSDDDSTVETLWQRRQNHASHCLVYERSGEIVTMDYDVARGMDQCVILDCETGDERARIDTDSPVQSVLFPCPGWDRDFYVMTMTTITRVAVA